MTERGNDGTPAPGFHLADWYVEPRDGSLSRGESTVRLEPKVMDVLVHLARRPGRVVSRQEIESDVWAGRVVSYDALTGTMLKLRKAFGDDARNPRIVETVSKRGYRLLVPVVWEKPSGRPTPGAADRGEDARRSRTPVAIALTLAVLVAVAVALELGGFSRVQPETTSPKGIVVLPFDDLSRAPSPEYFADGVTDDLITALARNPGLFVIARDSAFLYKGQPKDVRHIARELRVRYLLDGTVRRTGDTVRLNVQLVEGATGSLLWAEHYEVSGSGLFDVHDEIVRNVESVLSAGRRSPELRRPASAAAYEAFLHGRNRFFKYASKQENLAARELYEKAVDLDPDYALSHAMLGWTHAFDAMNGWSEDRDASLARALALARQAAALDPTLPVAYFVAGLAYRERGEYERALVEAEKATALDPNYANGHVLVATLLYYDGRPIEGLARIRHAMRLNPHHPYNYPFHLGQAQFILGDYAAAIAAFEQGLSTNPSSERMRVWLAAAYASSGRVEDARWEAEQVLTLNPDFSPDRIRQAFPFRKAGDMETFMKGLRKAGLAR